MGTQPIQQLEEIIKKSKDILIFIPQNPDGDSIGAAWAFYFFLANQNLSPTIVVSDPFENIGRFDFLPRPKKLSYSLSGARDFILSFNTKHNEITDVRTERSAEELRIYITPKQGSIDPRDFSFIPAKFKYDLVITLNSSDKETLGKIYEENPDIFYEVPVVNIDRHINNDKFGQINIIDITASSTCEILSGLFQNEIDENISNCLLSGIISATESFQNKHTTPKSLQVSAMLMDKGADQQNIIRHLYKTQPFNLLKLWGRLMAQLKWNEELRLAWSVVSIEDFVQSRSKPNDIPFIIKKIQENYSSGKIFLIIYNESPEKIKGIIKFSDTEKIKNAQQIVPGGEIKGDIYEFSISNKDIADAEKEIIENLRKQSLL
ncbi:MAG: DHH family phosphoesterase [Candidatus Moranbacteria bacterium]|jgi:phosphoesterase RecJ-like protein|nr:DHH family phosphoesterase [Candidatus Moranbacteria bacterium]